MAVFVGVARGSSADHWRGEWDETSYGDVDYYVDSGLPAPFNNATAKSEMGLARQTWNNVGSAPVLVDYGGTISMGGVTCDGSGINAVPNGRAYVKACNLNTQVIIAHTGDQVIRALVIVDTVLPSGTTWHADPSTSVPSNKKDLRGAVAHELGHLLGAFDPATSTALHINLDCNNISAAQTMCPSHLNGTANYRSAQTHESNDFVNAY